MLVFQEGMPEDVWVVPAAGGSARRLTPGAALSPPHWSPDGRWIHFQSSRSGQYQLWRMPSAGGEATPVTPPGRFWHRFSPDGKTVFYARKEGARVRFLESPSGGGRERLLAEIEERPGALTATDGRFLYFTWSQPFSDVWVMDIVGQ
jgi:Tol biopolymer transport system component